VKRMDSIIFGRAVLSLIFWAMPAMALFPVESRAETVALVLKQSSFLGGQISPEPGLYYFEQNTEVKLTANARSGYMFVGWLGNVSDPTAITTVVYLDQPKVVVAVFEHVISEVQGEDTERATISGGSSGGFARRYGGISVGAVGGGSSYSYARPSDRTRPCVVIPEPATIILFGLIAIKIRRRSPHRTR